MSAASSGSNGGVYPARLGRRTFMRLGCYVAMGGASAMLGGVYSLFLEPEWLEVTQHTVRLPYLPAALDGLSIAHISDIHWGGVVRPELVRRAVKAVNALSPDLIVLTGDFVSRATRDIHGFASELAPLRAAYGLYAVLGNHDVWRAPSIVADALRQVGAVVLRDEGSAVVVRGERLWLLGIEDSGYSVGGSYARQQLHIAFRQQAAKLTELMAPIPIEEPRLLLVHNPDLNELLEGFPLDLAFCGHTHGGQVVLPFVGAPVVPSFYGQKYRHGLVQGPACPVYINRGLGMVPPPVRLNCRPEVALLRLAR